jgi:[ribosomal protein S5]-alanine N-acetyltransferase
MKTPPEFSITLEPRTAAHAEELFAVLSEQRLYEFLDEDPPPSVEALRQKFARGETGKSPDGSEHWLNWVVRDEARQVAGYVQATILANSETYIAYVIASSHWGRGLAYRAADQMLRILAAEFGVKTFFAVAERENGRSIRLAARLGFSAATPEQSARRAISASEVLMQRVEP